MKFNLLYFSEMDQYFRGKEYKKIHTIALDQPEECLTLTMLSVGFELPPLAEQNKVFT